ncbi:M56 family metallopeptidase [Bengtsoniella intestinalis]|uniref:M56 family metallopeptidase n=1 Tax=Bengtsoniella intestinalis TaxID=3073143 RepID=UPI00391F06EB
MTQWILSSSVLIVCIVALRRLLRGRITQRVQYALWGLVLVRLLVPVQFGSTAMSVNNVTQEPDFLIAQEAILPTVTADTPTVELIPTLEPSVSVEATPQLPSMETIITALWITGSIAVGLWFGYTNLRFGRMLKRNRVLLDDDSTKLPVYMVDGLATPCLFGSAIYVTPTTVDNPQQLAHVLAHEGNHHRHGDHIWSLLRCLCLVVHWYNPLVWCAAVLSCRDCELACDESTMESFTISDRIAYGRTLLEMTCAQTPSLLMTASTMVGGKKTLKERIGRIANKPNMARYTVIGLSVVVMCVIGFTFTGAEAKDIAIIGGADGPTAVFETEIVGAEVLDVEVTQQLATPTGASIQLLVTATQLDSVLLYTGWDEVPLNNYRFGNATEGTLFDSMDGTIIQYVYSDEDDALQDNQFCLKIAVENAQLEANQAYTLKLSAFGIYAYEQGDGAWHSIDITPLYDDVWTVDLMLTEPETAGVLPESETEKSTDGTLVIPTVEDILANGYPVNENGETYGQAVKDSNLETPDLQLAQNADGVKGYIRESETPGAWVSTPEEAADYMETAQTEPSTINLYLHDGVTVIGQFEVSANSYEQSPFTSAMLTYLEAMKEGTQAAIGYIYIPDENQREAYLSSPDTIDTYFIQSMEQVNENLWAYTLLISGFSATDTLQEIFNFVGYIDGQYWVYNNQANIPDSLRTGLDPDNYQYLDESNLGLPDAYD